MYNSGDESYRLLPKVMTENTVNWLIEKTIQHCKKYKIKEFEFILHGGEPLLAGKEFFERFAKKARQQLGAIGVSVRIGVQTNGIMIDAGWCKLLNTLSINIGISIDGPAWWHDKYRMDHQLNGTHAKTIAGLRAAQKEQCKIGVLSVMDATSNPIEMYDYFKGLNIKDLDFLWPDHHHEKLPELYLRKVSSPTYTPFGDWWITLFDYWFNDSHNKPRIRFLNQVILMILGVDAGFESLGGEENRYLIIETDGEIEASDYLKACGNGFTKEGINITTHELSDALNAPLMKMHRQSHRMLADTCRQCSIRDVCGGGHIAHRYGNGRGFSNSSVYCFDLMKLLTHIQNRLLDRLSAETIRQARLTRMSYADALDSINV
ncbi:hypothetical protein GCM10011325_35480 [Dyadobacter sediminis]|nr:hypothetical protein GCM10011325_35480 [Dyadobacter sediminis]